MPVSVSYDDVRAGWSPLIRRSDVMSSSGSTSVYSEEELRKLIHYVKQLRFVGKDYGYSACVVG